MADDSHAFSSLPAERIALIAAYAPSLQVNAVRVADDGSLTELATTHLPRGGWNGEIVDATHL